MKYHLKSKSIKGEKMKKLGTIERKKESPDKLSFEDRVYFIKKFIESKEAEFLHLSVIETNNRLYVYQGIRDNIWCILEPRTITVYRAILLRTMKKTIPQVFEDIKIGKV